MHIHINATGMPNLRLDNVHTILIPDEATGHWEIRTASGTIGFVDLDIKALTIIPTPRA